MNLAWPLIVVMGVASVTPRNFAAIADEDKPVNTAEGMARLLLAANTSANIVQYAVEGGIKPASLVVVEDAAFEKRLAEQRPY